MPPYAEDMNYFKTSKKSADAWLDDTVELVESISGKVTDRAIVKKGDREVCFIKWEHNHKTYQFLWETLPVKLKGNERAARVQMVTALYHAVKAKVIEAKFRGVDTAFAGDRLVSGEPIALLADKIENQTLLLIEGEVNE